MALHLNIPDRNAIRSFNSSDSNAKIIFDHLAKFQNNMGETKVDQLAWRLSESLQNPPSRWDIIKFFRKLEVLHCGKLVEGRKGKKTRFVWGSNLTDVAKVAAGQNVKIGVTPPGTGAELGGAAEEPGANGLVDHPFKLRKDLDICLQLPVDLTKAEATRLATFVQSLPFDEVVSA
jgi:hypothetical protein